MYFVALVPLVVGLAIAVIGFLGLRQRLPRNRFGGVRTEATLRDDETFRVANRVAGLPVLVGGLVGAVSGVIALVQPSTSGVLVTVAVGTVGTVGMLGIAIAGGALGHLAAEAVPERRDVPAGCAGCACGGGCELSRSVGANVAGVGGE